MEKMELKCFLQSQGLSTKGTKAELVARLAAAAGQVASSTATGWASDDAATRATFEEGKMKVGEMRAVLGKRGLETKGLKAELEQRLHIALNPKASKNVVGKASTSMASKPNSSKVAAIAKLISAVGVPESFVGGYAQSLVAEGFDTKTQFRRLDEAVMLKCGIKKGHIRAISKSQFVEVAALEPKEGKQANKPAAGKPKASKKRSSKESARPAKKSKANPKQAFRDNELACSLIRALHQRFPNDPKNTTDPYGFNKYSHKEDHHVHMSNLAMVALVEFVQAFLGSFADCTESAPLVTSDSIESVVDDFPPKMSVTILRECTNFTKNFARQNKVKLADLETATWASLESKYDLDKRFETFPDCKDRDAEDEANRRKTGLQFNVGSLNRLFLLKKKTLSVGALLYATTALECVCAEILEVATKEAKDCARTFIRYPHVQLGIQIHSEELEHLFSFTSSVVEDDDICWRVLPPSNESIWPQIEKKMQSMSPDADCAWAWPTAMGNRPDWIPSVAADAKKAANARKDGPHFEESVRMYFKEWKQEAKLPWRTLRSTRGGVSGSTAGITKQSKAKLARLAGDKPRWLTIGNGLYGPFLCDKK
jgi:hypothetical protein